MNAQLTSDNAPMLSRLVSRLPDSGPSGCVPHSVPFVSRVSVNLSRVLSRVCPVGNPTRHGTHNPPYKGGLSRLRALIGRIGATS